MEEFDEDQMHPNWVALATVKFKPKIFVKSTTEDNIFTEDNTNSEKQQKETIEIDGSACKAYEEILQLPSTSTHEKSQKQFRKRRKIEKVKFEKEVLFSLSVKDDAEGIRKLIKQSETPDVNARDAFGWTGLMMAACEGAVNSCKALLDFGADFSLTNLKGNTAATLAEKKGFPEILEILRQAQEPVEISDDDSEQAEDHETKFCEDCGIEIKKSTSKSHETSTVHLFSCKFRGNDKIKGFGIPQSNRGFQLMRKSGWDGNSALGARQSGKLYPIRTVIRKKNSGLGTAQDPSKITHFKAHDTRAVHFRPPPRALTRKEIHDNDLRDKRHEQRLRRDLS